MKRSFFQTNNFFFRNKKIFSRNNFCSVFYFMYCKAKKIFGAIWKFLKFFIFWNLLRKFGSERGISIDADSGPPRYVTTLMLRWYLSRSPHFFSDWLWTYCDHLSIADYDHTTFRAGTLTCTFLESRSMTVEFFFVLFITSQAAVQAQEIIV